MLPPTKHRRRLLRPLGARILEHDRKKWIPVFFGTSAKTLPRQGSLTGLAFDALGVHRVLAEVSLIGEPHAVLEASRGAPAEFFQPADVEQLARRAVRPGGIKADPAGVASGRRNDAGDRAAAVAGTESPWVFPSRVNDGPRDAIQRPWGEICKAAGFETTLRVHDLRHTYASILASAGLSLPIIGKLLGHTNPLTTNRDAHLFDDPLRAATERVGAIVDAGRKPSGEVVEIKKRK
jgi:hypothetical protein